MKIIIEHYDRTSTVEISDETSAYEAIECFMRLLVTDQYAWETVVNALPDLLEEYCEKEK